jgi:hypothetical protein
LFLRVEQPAEAAAVLEPLPHLLLRGLGRVKFRL